MNISLPETLKSFVDEQVNSRGFGTSSEYVRALIRKDHGPGYRIYFVQRGEVVIVLLAGGDKSTQDKNIRNAKALAKDLKES